jgi:hypothetical protein
MQPTFDPVRKRKFWLDFNLNYETRFEPEEIPARGTRRTSPPWQTA